MHLFFFHLSLLSLCLGASFKFQPGKPIFVQRKRGLSRWEAAAHARVHDFKSVCGLPTCTPLVQDDQAVCAPVGQQEEHVTSESQQEMPNLHLSLRKT